jgi:hypothetical protein
MKICFEVIEQIAVLTWRAQTAFSQIGGKRPRDFRTVRVTQGTQGTIPH